MSSGLSFRLRHSSIYSILFAPIISQKPPCMVGYGRGCRLCDEEVENLLCVFIKLCAICYRGLPYSVSLRLLGSWRKKKLDHGNATFDFKSQVGPWHAIGRTTCTVFWHVGVTASLLWNMRDQTSSVETWRISCRCGHCCQQCSSPSCHENVKHGGVFKDQRSGIGIVAFQCL